MPEKSGFDALNNKYTDMIEAGILDPTKVTRLALENAASIAGLLLTTQTSCEYLGGTWSPRQDNGEFVCWR